MRFELVVVGKLREKWLQKGVDEYCKRLTRHGKISIVEIPDLPCPKSVTEHHQVIDKEGEQILARLSPRSYVIALDVKGKSLDSPGLADLFSRQSVQGISDISFIIGGSLGLGEQVLKRADLRLSFSAFTFPHQMMRVILLEQIYRACKINAGETYHK